MAQGRDQGAVTRIVELAPAGIPRLQAFFASNPEYHVAVNGEAPGPEEARTEFEAAPPPGWPYTRKWVLEFQDEARDMAGMVDLLAGLFAADVWHIGLFVVATRLHGTGEAHRMYRQLEDWMRERGANWIRLGVVEGNTRAERFWARCGYEELRKRPNLPMGKRVNTVRVLYKALAGGTRDEYLSLVERDRPDPP